MSEHQPPEERVERVRDPLRASTLSAGHVRVRARGRHDRARDASGEWMLDENGDVEDIVVFMSPLYLMKLRRRGLIEPRSAPITNPSNERRDERSSTRALRAGRWRSETRRREHSQRVDLVGAGRRSERERASPGHPAPASTMTESQLADKMSFGETAPPSPSRCARAPGPAQKPARQAPGPEATTHTR